MSELNSNVIIENGQVVFSKEVLEYFESIKTEENKEWIEKYFQILSDPSNFNAEKYNVHHIRPCFTFKDENHKNRKETQKLGDNFNDNKIKLSIYNHFFAHYYLWKIFNNHDSKHSFQRMCGQSRYKDNLTENELVEIAKLKEECAKKNRTKEELREYGNDYYRLNKEIILYKHKNKRSEYYRINKDKLRFKHKLWLIQHKDEVNLKTKKLRSQLCYDPIKKDKCSYGALCHRKLKNKNLYAHIDIKRCIIESPKERELYNNEQLNKIPIFKKLCYDPVKNEKCTYRCLSARKLRNSELYKDVVLKDCVIND